MARGKDRFATVNPHELVCGICGYMSKGEIGMKLHHKVSHESIEVPISELNAPLRCTICGDSFENEKRIRKHAARTKHYS